MKTKRMKKLLMSMGLSRNQVNQMVAGQRKQGSAKVSNFLYYTKAKGAFGDLPAEFLPYLCRFTLS